MTDPIMDFFDDPNLFVGGLEVLSDDGFNAGPSLVDELNLVPDFEPLQVDPMGTAKHINMMQTPAPTSSQQGLAYASQMGHFDTIKAQSNMGQPYSGAEGNSGFMAQQPQFQGTPMGQAPQANGLFPNSSPMWGNHDQNRNAYHPLSQQQQQQQQQQQHQQQHQRQQQHPCQQTQQQQPHGHHQLLNQHQPPPPHQQVNPQAMHQRGKPFQEHHNFASYYQGNMAQNQQQQQSHHGSLNTGGSPFHCGVVPNASPQSKPYRDPSNPISSAPQQQQGGYPVPQQVQSYPGLGTEEANMAYSMQSSPMPHALSSCSVSTSAAAGYPPSQYSFPRQPVGMGVSQPLSSGVVSMTTTSSARGASAHPVPDLSSSSCPFSSAPGLSQPQPHPQQQQQQQQQHHHQQQQQQQQQRLKVAANQSGEQCPFRSMQRSKPAYSTSDMYPETATSFSATAESHFPPQQQRSCQVSMPLPPANTTSTSSTNGGYQAMEKHLLHETQGGGFEGLEAPDLLDEDFLPQLEAALSQHEGSNCSWTNGSQGEGDKEDQEDQEEEALSIHYEIQVGYWSCEMT